MGDKITPEVAAKLLHIDAQTLRYWMQDGAIDIGVAHRRTGSTRYTYYISEEKLMKLIGGTANELQQNN